jgi:hypothetical protein
MWSFPNFAIPDKIKEVMIQFAKMKRLGWTFTDSDGE